MDSIKVVSLNAKGLNIPEKRRMLLTDLRNSRADVAFIQETHFKHDKFPLLKNRFFPVAYHSTNPAAKTKGVSILISSRLPWQCQAALKDPEGRFVFLRGLVGDTPLTLASIYAPNEHQDTFITSILDKLGEFTAGQLILGGDFNIPLIPSSDTSSGHSSVPPTHRKCIANSLHKAQLVDVWRLQHSGERDYTFYSQTHKLYSRIDYFLIPHNQLHSVVDSSIGLITWSDHAPITLTYTLTGHPRLGQGSGD